MVSQWVYGRISINKSGLTWRRLKSVLYVTERQGLSARSNAASCPRFPSHLKIFIILWKFLVDHIVESSMFLRDSIISWSPDVVIHNFSNIAFDKFPLNISISSFLYDILFSDFGLFIGVLFISDADQSWKRHWMLTVKITFITAFHNFVRLFFQGNIQYLSGSLRYIFTTALLLESDELRIFMKMSLLIWIQILLVQ